MTASSIEPATRWVDAFRQRHGRDLRVLHIGNIANNAYRIAGMLRQRGVHCDVLCYDYYHTMGCPEWDSADFTGELKDQARPDWRQVDLKGFSRPRWFAQGPMMLAVQYLRSQFEGDLADPEALWQAMSFHCQLPDPATGAADSGRSRGDFDHLIRNGKASLLRRTYQQLKRFSRRIPPVAWAGRKVVGTLRKIRAKYHARRRRDALKHARLDWLHEAWSQKLGDRADTLLVEDYEGYREIMPALNALFQHYDLIHGYATDGVYPMLARRPYVALEHGTIRAIPFQPTAEGRLCALTFCLAADVCITNADNIVAARRLKLDRYKFIPHPIDETHFDPDSQSETLRSDLRRKLSADFIVFHPTRQHWETSRPPSWEKGNDIFIRGLARFLRETPNAGAVFVNWGKTVSQSKALLSELGIASRIHWIEPVPHRWMIRYMHATEATADQFYLGAFGSITPLALGLGKPALLHLNQEVHDWCFPQPPPVLPSSTPEEVYAALKRLQDDPAWRDQVSRDSRQWYAAHHSAAVITERLLAMYESVVQVNEG